MSSLPLQIKPPRLGHNRERYRSGQTQRRGASSLNEPLAFPVGLLPCFLWNPKLPPACHCTSRKEKGKGCLPFLCPLMPTLSCSLLASNICGTQATHSSLHNKWVCANICRPKTHACVWLPFKPNPTKGYAEKGGFAFGSISDSPLASRENQPKTGCSRTKLPPAQIKAPAPDFPANRARAEAHQHHAERHRLKISTHVFLGDATANW